MLRENLTDILKHTHSLGFLDFVKLDGDSVKAISPDLSVALRGKLNHPISELQGQKVGMANMGILKGLLEFPSFEMAGANIFINNSDTKDGGSYPRDIIFSSPDSHSAKYTFMSGLNADKKVKVPKFIDSDFDVVFEISPQNIKDITYFTGFLNSVNKVFNVNLIDGNLEFILGDDNTCKTIIPIATNVEGTISNDMHFPIAQVLAILKLADHGTCTILLKNNAGMFIKVKSQVGEYTYSLQSRRAK